MLYDPKWEKEAEQKADPLSIGSLISWIEKQPAKGGYCWSNSGGCLLFMWLQSMDPKVREGEGHSFNYVFRGNAVDLHHFSSIALGDESTFSAALKRARASQTTA